MTRPRAESLAVPTQHLRMALRTLQPGETLLHGLLLGTGFSIADLDDPDFVLPVSALSPLCTNAANMFGDDWFLNFPVMWSTDAHSEFGMAVRFAPNFGMSLDLVVEFSHVRWPVLRIARTVSKAGHTLVMTPIERITPEIWRVWLCLGFLSFQTTAKAILATEADTIQYNMEGPAPSYAERLEALFDGNLSWDNQRASIFVPLPLLSQVSPLANRNSFSAMLSSLRHLASRQFRKEELSIRVAHTLDGLSTGRMGADEMARRLGVSKRTLERRLEREGHTFRDLSEQSLKNRFSTLITEPGLGTHAIADRLGFHDASSLLRACRRWFGASPSEIRRRMRAL